MGPPPTSTPPWRPAAATTDLHADHSILPEHQSKVWGAISHVLRHCAKWDASEAKRRAIASEGGLHAITGTYHVNNPALVQGGWVPTAQDDTS